MAGFARELGDCLGDFWQIARLFVDLGNLKSSKLCEPKG